MTTTNLLRDVIHIPQAVHKADLVFQLADTSAKAQQTVDEYVVTEQLQASFIDAVKLLRSALADNASKAAFLHGSFGSGKSNFMGILQLLLDGNVAARSVPELAPVVAELDKGTGKFLTVPFHLVGADDLESAVFGQYANHVAAFHPDAPAPAVYASEPILVNGDELRRTMGDDAFFKALGSTSSGGDDGWGDLSAGWDASSYEAARRASHGDVDRTRLVQALLGTLLTSFASGAQANRSGYVDFADGLSAISQHAQSLGYDGIIFFLDELILWFLSRLGDTPWVSKEAAKLSKLVEPGSSKRPIPIVSIIARQRDLKDLVGDDVPGAEQLSFADQLDYQAGRFDTITLDDSNLPVVANKRLLKPVDDQAAAQLQQAFKSLSLSQRTRDALLAGTGDDQSFALTYPFSPAFMTVLVDVAGALQRTRTGLRVLLDLLVARRDELQVGQLVPVGDLYDVIASSDDPFSDAMRASFDQARKIYNERLRPALLAEHSLGTNDTPTTAFINEDRLLKTLLLAALVPQSVPFKDLTVERLVALNHGTIASPVPGQETSIAVAKLKKLAAQAGELRLGSDPHNPTVAIVLSDVDTGAILGTAAAVDNTANRRTLIRSLVLDELGLSADQLDATPTNFLWRGLPRSVTVMFGNLRDRENLPDHAFVNDSTNWKLLVDFPFDDPGHSPAEDLARLQRFVQNGESWSTLAWLPAFFTATTLDTLGRLVRLNHVLANDDRFAEATKALSPIARAAARPQLEAMRSMARDQIRNALLMAYGVTSADPNVVDNSHALTDHFPSLRTGLTVQPPAAATLRDAFEKVLDQALRFSFPGAPDLDTEVKLSDVKRVAELCSEAVVAADGRLLVNDTANRRLLARVANPLKLGVQSEQAFKLQDTAEHWDNTFTRAINRAVADGESATVGLLRRAINNPNATGLSNALENLIILVWAQGSNHTFRHHGGPVTAAVERLSDEWTVEAQRLPDPTTWEKTVTRLASVFGERLPTSQLSGYSVERAAIALRTQVDRQASPVATLVPTLERRGEALGIADADNHRLRTARGAHALLRALADAGDDVALVEALATADLAPSDQAMAKSITSATEINAALQSAQWPIIDSATTRPEGSGLATQLRTALAADEFVTPLRPVLTAVQNQAVELLSGPAPVPVTPPAVPGGGISAGRTWTGTDVTAARAKLNDLSAQIADGSLAPDDVTVTITWVGDPNETAG